MFFCFRKTKTTFQQITPGIRVFFAMPQKSENYLVWTPTFKYVAQMLNEKKRLEYIISPYIKRKALKQLLDECDDTSNLRVIVRWDPKDLVYGASDVEIYEDLKSKGIALYYHQSIHLKILVFNRNWAFHTSGNITQKGLGLSDNPNIEVGAQIRLNQRDWEEIDKVFREAVLVDDDLYEKFKHYTQENKLKPDPLPQLILEPLHLKPFSNFNLPATQSPEKLYEIYENPDVFKDDDDLLSACVHDINLYKIDLGLDKEKFIYKLGSGFQKDPFIQAVVGYIKEKDSVRSDEMNAWITSQCSDNPTPYRWEIKEATNKLYDWLSYYFQEITWDVPEAHSQVIYYKNRGVRNN